MIWLVLYAGFGRKISDDGDFGGDGGGDYFGTGGQPIASLVISSDEKSIFLIYY